MRTIRFTLLLWLFVAPTYAEIYKWTDSQGVVHFSDEDYPGAEKVELPKIQTFSPPETQTPQKNLKGAVDTVNQPDYQLSIVEPRDQATIRNNQGQMALNVEVHPQLKSDDKLQVIYDGVPLGEPQSSTTFILNDIERGAHTIQAQLLNSKRQVVTKSDLIKIYMHRPRVGMVPQTRPANRR